MRPSLKLASLVAFVSVLAACPAQNNSEPDAGTPDSGTGGGAPQLVGLTPTEGPLEGGTTVLITGSNFEAGAKVYFGEVQASEENVLVTSARRISAKAPPMATAGAVDLKVENPDGQVATLTGAFTYVGPISAGITEAKLVGPAVEQDNSGADPISVTVKADVEVPMVTEASGQGAGIQAQVGMAKLDSNLTLSDLSWSNASYASDVDGASSGDKARDRYQGKVSLPGTSTGSGTVNYVVAMRFSLDGSSWTIADLDGASNGSTLSKLQKIEVSPKSVIISKCKLQFPATLETREGVTTGNVYGWVWAPGVTDGAGKGANVVAEVGYGPHGTEPTDAAWHWSAATYNVDKDNESADEYQGTFTGPSPGTYDYAYRFSVAGGAKTYCDLDGSDIGGYTSAQAGGLISKALGIDSCMLVGPSTYSVASGQTTQTISARVTAGTITDGMGQGAGISGEVGYGPAGTMPGSSGWSFVPATYSSDQDNDASDEYAATLTPSGFGSNRVAYRFQFQGGAYFYCDLDGSANGWTEAQAAALSVVPACKLDRVTAAGQSTQVSTVESGDPLEATARLYLQGITDQTGAAANMIAQVGVGSGDALQGAGWGWADATFQSDDTTTGEDVWTASFSAAYTGTRAVSFRFSADNGATWAYCDLDGNGVGGYTEAQQAALTVNPHAELDYCNLQSPYSVSQQTGTSMPTTIFGQVYEPGVTDVANTGADIVAELGYGQESEDPGVAWTWLPATFNVMTSNNDEYQASFPASLAAGSYSYAFRYRLAGSTKWCFGDIDGNGANGASNGFSGGMNLGQATVTP